MRVARTFLFPLPPPQFRAPAPALLCAPPAPQAHRRAGGSGQAAGSGGGLGSSPPGNLPAPVRPHRQGRAQGAGAQPVRGERAGGDPSSSTRSWERGCPPVAPPGTGNDPAPQRGGRGGAGSGGGGERGAQLEPGGSEGWKAKLSVGGPRRNFSSSVSSARVRVCMRGAAAVGAHAPTRARQ